MKNLPLYWKIIIGMVLGVLYGLIANSFGWNALHWAACTNRTNTDLIQLLLNNMSLDSINQQDDDGETPLDWCYAVNDSPIEQEIIALLRSKGGIANNHDENGNEIDSSDEDDEDD